MGMKRWLYRAGWGLLLLCCTGCGGKNRAVLTIAVDWGGKESVGRIPNKKPAKSPQKSFYGMCVLNPVMFPFARTEVSAWFSAQDECAGMAVSVGKPAEAGDTVQHVP